MARVEDYADTYKQDPTHVLTLPIKFIRTMLLARNERLGSHAATPAEEELMDAISAAGGVDAYLKTEGTRHG